MPNTATCPHPKIAVLLKDPVSLFPDASLCPFSQEASTILLRLFLPAFALHVAQKTWWWLTVPHAPLPVTLSHTHVMEVLFFLATSYSWVFRTVCFLYVCVLFWSICGLQVRFHD
jgi:hypothetical protein